MPEERSCGGLHLLQRPLQLLQQDSESDGTGRAAAQSCSLSPLVTPWQTPGQASDIKLIRKYWRPRLAGEMFLIAIFLLICLLCCLGTEYHSVLQDKN